MSLWAGDVRVATPKSRESGDACSPSTASGWQCEAAATVPPGKGAKMENKPLSWIMAARKFGIVNADEMFPENDEPRRKQPAKKLVRTQTAKTGQHH